jgi:hypothetical protein
VEDFEGALEYKIKKYTAKQSVFCGLKKIQENFLFALSSIPTITPKEHP